MFWRCPVKALLWQHRVFLAVLGAGALVRVIALLAYHPALWFSDSLGYAAIGLRPYPTVIRPAGYALFLLWPFHWLHSFLAIVVIQHILGLASAAIMYALLLRRGIRPWLAAAASAPVLLSAYQIQIEHFILSDCLFAFLLIAAVAVLLWNRNAGWPACAGGGLLLAAAAITRSEGLALVAVPALWLLTRPGVPWRVRMAKAALVCVAFALPMLGYANWFRTYHGHLQITYSSGAFLASRAESFATCQTDNIPRADRWLCAKPGHRPDWYIWTHGTPLASAKGGAFTSVNNARGTAFALRVFKAQPGDYLTSTWLGVLQNFKSGGSAYGDSQAAFAFPARAPMSLAQLAAANPGNPTAPIYHYDAHPSTRLSQPWVVILGIYQHVVVAAPAIVGMIVLAGLGGIALAWKRWGAPGLLPWLLGAAMLVFPAATSGFSSRYELVAVAPLCLAAALGVMEIRGHKASQCGVQPERLPAGIG
jgi:hypothetical protein